MTYDVFDVCAQIREDWAETRMDAGPSKKCPGGYSIPADKECGGGRDQMKQRYKTAGAVAGGALGPIGSVVGSKVGSVIARRRLAKGAEPTSVDTSRTTGEWKRIRDVSRVGAMFGPLGTTVAGAAADLTNKSTRERVRKSAAEAKRDVSTVAKAGASRLNKAQRALRGK